MTTLLCASPYCALPGIHAAEPEPEHDEATCRGCQPARADDGLYLCRRCAGLLERDPLEAARLYVDLGQVLAGGSGGSERGPGGTSAGVELHPVAVEVRSLIRSTLVALCRMVAEERGITGPRDDVLSMAIYLSRHARWLAAHRAAGEHARDLRDVVTDGRTKRVAYAVSSDRTLIGLCNQPREAAGGELEPCGARLWSRGTLPDDDEERKPAPEEVIDCPQCGASGTVRWWRWELCALGDDLEVMDAYEAAAYLSWRWAREVQPGTVWQWGRRYADAGMLRELCDVTPLGAVEREWVEGKPLKDRQGRVLFVREMLERRAERMWGAPADALAKVGG